MMVARPIFSSRSRKTDLDMVVYVVSWKWTRGHYGAGTLSSCSLFVAHCLIFNLGVVDFPVAKREREKPTARRAPDLYSAPHNLDEHQKPYMPGGKFMRMRLVPILMQANLKAQKQTRIRPTAETRIENKHKQKLALIVKLVPCTLRLLWLASSSIELLMSKRLPSDRRYIAALTCKKWTNRVSRKK